MSDLFTAIDDSAPTISEISSELTQLSGLGGAVANVGVNQTSLQTLIPSTGNSSLASNTQKLQELFAAAQTTGKTNFASQLSSITGTKTTRDFKATIASKTNSGDVVTFVVSPSIDETRQANYEHLSPVHHPGTIQVYRSTDARTFNINAKLIARTSEEASANIVYLNLIRSWLMPYYGQGTAGSAGSDKLGAPPDILLFSSYGSKNIDQLPVVLLNYHWVYPDNVDYIPSNEGIPFPTLMDISLTLIEAYSPEEYTGFDITKYKSGDMVNAYTFSSTPANSTNGSTTTTAPQYTPPSGASVTNSPTSL